MLRQIIFTLATKEQFLLKRNIMQEATNIYFANFFLYETKFKSKFDCASHMNKVLWEFCIRNIYYNFCIFILKYSHLFEYEKLGEKTVYMVY